MGETDNYDGCLKFSWPSEYYHRFAKPMMKLTMKGAPFVWTDDCEASFHTLKEKLVSAPILVLPESGKRFIVYTDASCVGLGYEFIKEGKVISYASRKLSMRRIILHMTYS